MCLPSFIRGCDADADDDTSDIPRSCREQERVREREECFCVSLSFYTSSASAAPSDRLSPILLCSFGARLIPLYLISSSFSLSLPAHLASVATANFVLGILRLWNDRCTWLVLFISGSKSNFISCGHIWCSPFYSVDGYYVGNTAEKPLHEAPN